MTLLHNIHKSPLPLGLLPGSLASLPSCSWYIHCPSTGHVRICTIFSCLFLSAHVPKLYNITAILPIVSYTIYLILADTFPKLFKVTCTCLIVLVWTIEPQNLKSSSFKSSIPSNFTMPLLFLTSTFMQSSLLQQTFT